MTRILSRFLIFLGLLTASGSFSIFAQENSVSCSQMEYENHNQINPKVVHLSGIQGIAVDETGTKLWDGCVGVFSKDGSQLIAITKIRSDGSFTLSKLARGEYILVVKSPGFCPANNAVKIGSKIRSKRNLIARRRPSAIDVCSWIESK